MVDVSDNGALLEGGARLLPGTHVDAHIVTREGRVLVRSRVVRAYVCHIAADVVRYRGALMFDRRVDTSAAGYAVPGGGTASPGQVGTGYPGSPADERAAAGKSL